jgi:hypothetical protein
MGIVATEDFTDWMRNKNSGWLEQEGGAVFFVEGDARITVAIDQERSNTIHVIVWAPHSTQRQHTFDHTGYEEAKALALMML